MQMWASSEPGPSPLFKQISELELRPAHIESLSQLSLSEDCLRLIADKISSDNALTQAALTSAKGAVFLQVLYKQGKEQDWWLDFALADLERRFELARIIAARGSKLVLGRLSSFIADNYSSLPASVGLRVLITDIVLSRAGSKQMQRLISTIQFWRDLQSALRSFDQTLYCKQATNILRGMLPSLSKQQHGAQLLQTFLCLYQNLDQFAGHLTKDVWKGVKRLFAPAHSPLISRQTLLGIVVDKLKRHPNQKLFRFCTKALFELEGLQDYSLKALFTQFKDYVYEQLVTIVSMGVNYSQSKLHARAAFTQLVVKFYSAGLAELEEDQLAEAIVRLARSIQAHIDFDHALATMALVLGSCTRPTRSASDQVVKVLIAKLNGPYKSTNLQKRVDILEGFFGFLESQMAPLKEEQTLVGLVEALPKQLKMLESSPFFKSFRGRVVGVVKRAAQQFAITSKSLKAMLDRELASQGRLTGFVVRLACYLSPQHQAELIEHFLFKLQSYQLSTYANLHERNSLFVIFARLVLESGKQRMVCARAGGFFLEELVLGQQTAIKDQSLLEEVAARVVRELFCSKEVQTRAVLSACINKTFDCLREGNNILPRLQLLGLIAETVFAELLVPGRQLYVEERLLAEGPSLLARIRGLKERAQQAAALRTTVRVLPLLFSDRKACTQVKGLVTQLCDDILGLAEQYSYSHYPELFRFLQRVFLPVMADRPPSERGEQQFLKLYFYLRETITETLCYNYGLEEIKGLFEFALSPMLFQKYYLRDGGAVSKVVQDALATGSNYWLFHRQLVLSLLREIAADPALLDSELALRLLELNEYRGWENSLVFGEYQISLQYLGGEGVSKAVDYFGGFGRYLTLRLISESENSEKHLAALMARVLEGLMAKELRSANLRYNTRSYFQKLYLLQALSVLAFRVSGQPIAVQFVEANLETLFTVLLESTHAPLRYYIEVAIARLCIKQLQCIRLLCLKLGRVLGDPTTHANLLVPSLLYAGLVMRNQRGTALEQQLFELLWPYSTSHMAYNRGIAQHYCYESPLSEEKYLRLSKAFSGKSKDSVKLNAKIAKTAAKFDQALQGCNLEEMFTSGEQGPQSIAEMLRIAADEFKEFKEGQEWLTHEKLFKELCKEALVNFPRQSLDFQKKMSPIQTELELFRQGRSKKDKQLIVVGSLVEKVHNLGHLVRTCEVFGAEALTISDRKVLDNQEFKAVSVTGEKWLNILEVPEKQVAGYLALMRAAGYQVVGLEQSGDSKEMQSFQFPRKCVLLLGNEKRGCPVELLRMLDRVVEIPQFGKVRSLNVHVSAVISIWEYVKQHSL